MSRLAVVAFSARAICPYTLAKKNTGMNAIMAIPRMTFSTVNVRFAKMCTLIRGDAVRRSTATNTARITMPAAMHTSMAGLPQPQMADCCRPNTLSPTPATISARPR